MDLGSDTQVNDNGKCDAENVDTRLLDDVKVEGTVENTGLLPGGSIGLSPPPVTKGRGLRKWRRIRRESGKDTNSSLDSNRKRGMTALPAGMKQRSEGSSSSTNAMSNVLGNALDHFPVYSDSGSGKGPDFGSRADSENSEDQNSRSSTAASAPRGNHELGVGGLGFSLSGKNSGVLVQQQEKSQNVMKKARGVKIRKENSISSMESDSRSSNLVFMMGTNSMTSNGRSNGRSGNYEGDDSDDAQNGDKHLKNETQISFSKNEADSEDVSHEDLAGENSWEIKEENIDEHVLGSGVPDALVDSIMPLHLAQEALEREVQKLRDVGKEETLSSEDLDQESGSTFLYEEFQSNNINETHLQSKLEEAFVMLELKNTKISELESTLKFTKIKTELEEFLTQRIAAEVEYLVISKTVQNLKTGHIDRINLEDDPDEMKEDTKKLKNRVRRYASCFIFQSVLLLVILYMFVLRFSSKTVEVIPT